MLAPSSSCLPSISSPIPTSWRAAPATWRSTCRCGGRAGGGRRGFDRAARGRCRPADQRGARPPGPVERTGGDRGHPPRRGGRGQGAASAVVTNPVAKNVLYRSGFAEPGHTEYRPDSRRKQQVSPRIRDDVVVARARSRPGDHPSAAQGYLRQAHRRARGETGRIVARDLRERFGMRVRAWPLPASIRTPARKGRWATRT